MHVNYILIRTCGVTHYERGQHVIQSLSERDDSGLVLLVLEKTSPCLPTLEALHERLYVVKGPEMREYCRGEALLDSDLPSKVFNAG
jgi:hypothetical protein